MKLEKLLRVNEVAYMTGLSIPSIYRLRRLGQFPNSVRVGLKAVAWHESDIHDFLASRKQGYGEVQDA